MPLKKTAMVLAALLFIQPFAAFAEQDGDEQQKIRIELTEQMQNAESAYQQAQKELTKEQQDYLAHLDKTLVKTLNPDARIMQTEAYLKSCMKSDKEISSNSDKYHGALKSWKNEIKTSQDKAWEKQRELYGKADFIDTNILRNHLHVEKAMILAVFDTMVQKNIEAGNYDCSVIKETLSDYL